LGAAGGQSVFIRQATHWWSAAHSLAGSAPQSPLVTHWTQAECAVSQTGLAPMQFELLAQPGTQVKR
jgi:hypothetical protein